MKKVGGAVVVAVFVLSAGAVFAARCNVDSVDGNKMSITCDRAEAKAGDTVTIKVKKVEGC